MNNSTLFSPTTLDTAPEGSRPVLEQIQKSMGFVPNLMATFANAPTVLRGYLAMDAEFNQTGFSPAERQLILLAASVENRCGYCQAAHSTILKGMMKFDGAEVAAVRQNETLGNAKHDALVRFVKEVVRERGHVTSATVEAFLSAGYSREQLMEVLLGVALKTVSNYLDHLSPAPIDPVFEAERA